MLSVNEIPLIFEALIFIFLISSREEDNRSAREVKRGDVVKKLDSRFTMYVDSFLFESIIVL
jgi:hypothetical protein